MIKSKGRRITWFVLTLILAMGMVGSSVFAADPVSPVPKETPGEGDGTTSSRMEESKKDNGRAFITLDKVFERYGTKWPDGQENFKYEVTKVRFWDNSNVNTDENGTPGNKAKMPNPSVDQTVNLTGLAADKVPTIVKKDANSEDTWVVTVPLKDGTGNNPKDETPDGVVASKWGENQFSLHFTRPGYYVYEVSEVDDQVPGVTYDKHKYYLAFYVANVTEGNKVDGITQGGNFNVTTGEGLYVHTITAWRTEALTGTNKQIFESVVVPEAIDPSFKTNNKYFLKIKYDEQFLSDAQNASNKVYYADPLVRDKDGKVTSTPIDVNDLVKGGTYWIEVTQEEVDAVVQRGEVGKVDRSQDQEKDENKKVGPNCLEINFWNETDSKDVELKKIVTGTLGDVNKEFEFTVNLTGLQKNTKYKITPNKESVALGKSIKTDGEYKDKGYGLTKDGNDYYVVTDANATTAEFKVVLKSGESIKIEGLPVNATYTTSEEKSDHVASYKVESDGFEYALQKDDTAASLNAKGYRLVVKDANDATKITDIRALKDEDLEGKTKIQIVKLANYKKSNEKSGTALALANAETVDPGDGAVTITYTNHRDIETETGIPGYVFPIVLAAMIALIGLAVVRRRKNVSSVNDFEF